MQKYQKTAAVLGVSFLLGMLGHVVPYWIHSNLLTNWMIGHMFHIVGSIMIPMIAIPWTLKRFTDKQPSCLWFPILLASGLFLLFGMILGIHLMEGNSAGSGSTKVVALYFSFAASVGVIANYLAFMKKHNTSAHTTAGNAQV